MTMACGGFGDIEIEEV